MAERIPAGLARLAGAVMLGALVMQLDMTMTGIATSALLDEFHAPLSTLQWVGTGYLLAMAAIIPLAGWSMERFGGRAVWIFSLTAFLAGSVLCGVSWSLTSLIAARVLQGLGGGMILPVAQAVLAQKAGPERLGRVMAAIGVPSLLGPVLGPVLGGVLVTELGWRWIFFVNVPICALAALAAWRIMPSDRPSGRTRLDVAGLVLLSAGSAALIYGFAEAGQRGSFSTMSAAAPLIAGAVLLLAFVLYALRAAEPLIDLRLFRNRGYAAAVAAMFFVTIVLFGAMGLLPLYYQQVEHFTAQHTGLLMIPFGLGMGLSLILAGRLADRMAPRGIALVGLLLAAGATITFTRLGGVAPVWVLVAQAVAGAGTGALLVPVMAAALRDLPAVAIPRASTALRIFQQLGGSFGSAILFIVLQRHVGPTSAGTADATAYGDTFWWSLVFVVLALVPVLLLPGRRPVPPAPAPPPPTAVAVSR